MPSVMSPEMPFEVRRASHEVANAAAKLQSAANALKRDADVFYDLVHAMQGSKDE